jgi:uncharacterized Zn finger protein (UPF0148 family)
MGILKYHEGDIVRLIGGCTYCPFHEKRGMVVKTKSSKRDNEYHVKFNKEKQCSVSDDTRDTCNVFEYELELVRRGVRLDKAQQTLI